QIVSLVEIRRSDRHRAGIRSVAVPERWQRVGDEKQLRIDWSQLVYDVDERQRALCTGDDVLDEDRLFGRPIAPPQLRAMGTVIGDEKKPPIYVGQLRRPGPLPARCNVGHQAGVAGARIELPQLDAVIEVEKSKKQDSVHCS